MTPLPAEPSQIHRERARSEPTTVAFGHSRVQLVWTQLKMSNGRAIAPERQADPTLAVTLVLRTKSGPNCYRRGLSSNSPANVIVNRYLVIGP